MIHGKAGTIITHCIGWLLFLLLPIPPRGEFLIFVTRIRGTGLSVTVARFDIVSIILYFLTLALSIAVITIRQLRISRKILFRLGKK
jgi:hypothetical protein